MPEGRPPDRLLTQLVHAPNTCRDRAYVHPEGFVVWELQTIGSDGKWHMLVERHYHSPDDVEGTAALLMRAATELRNKI